MSKRRRAAGSVIAIALAIEFLDEAVGGTRAAAWPLIQRDLDLSYAEIGLVLAVPAVLGNLVEPIIGVLGDTRWRRPLLLWGGVLFAAAWAAVALAPSFAVLLIASILAYEASTPFVSFAQATLMDLEPERRELNMARWTLAGSVAIVAAPLALVGATELGIGWRVTLLALALAALPVVAMARAFPVAHVPTEPLRTQIREAVTAFRRHEVLRWLAALEASDLLLDVFHGFIALYFVDVVGTSAATGAAAVAVWTGAGLAGDALLLLVLRRVAGVAYLRVSALAVLSFYPVFLLVPGTEAKLVLLALLGLLNAGWYAIPKAGLYSALPGRSGTAIAVGSVTGMVAGLIPLAIGVVAGAIGLGATMWALVLAPIGLLLLLPRRNSV